MASTVLGAVGGAVAGPVGAAVGRALGGVLDARLISSLAPVRRGPRIEALKVQGTSEGAPMAWVAGRARVTGQVIWAARFLEDRRTESAGKGGPRSESSAYSLSFAVAICEGEIDGIGRVWADGRPMDMSGVTMRVHRGGEDQAPDLLIEVVEGAAAPAYRGVAYAVFEDLALGRYGNRAPQLSFEVFRRPRGATPRLEDLLEGVCLIPGAGEFVLATEAVVRREGLTRTASENVHTGDGRPGLIVSLDQLQAQAPNLRRVSLVVGWFGSSVAAHQFTVKPGVERRDKPTEPLVWSVAGLGRADAHLISSVEGAPAYGGTPSDDSVRQAVSELKARGLEVTLYPFVFMDCEGYPWRGRMAGRNGIQATADVAAAFGAADGWGLRRMARHYAALAAESGADGLLIGSEMRGLTWTRDAAAGFPAVAALRDLAAECRTITGPGVALSYAADWSEWFGRHDGADVIFHLDPLWADANLDYVGIDFYPPLGDWRDGDGGLDAVAFAGPDDPAYLAAQVAGGENFDWFYASAEDRAAQVRTTIVDGAHGEDWVFRPKDLVGWWSNAHHDRPGGVRAATPTAWVPAMKPIRLTEFGCAAVDRGANAPNLFQDPKSDESALPPFSTGVRDDRMQRRAVEAVLGWYADVANNPVSSVYGGPMLAAADAWCWDARPWPTFPARDDLWADAGAWGTGHWLNGRLHGEGSDLAEAVLERAGHGVGGVAVAASPVRIDGLVLEGPTTGRDALASVCEALGLTPVERDEGVALLAPGPAGLELARDGLAVVDGRPSVSLDRKLDDPPATVRCRFIDGDAEYRTGAVAVRGGGAGEEAALELAVVCPAVTAEGAARRRLDRDGLRETATVALGPLDALRLEPGDAVTVEGLDGDWRVERIARDETPSATLVPMAPAIGAAAAADDPRGEEPVEAFGAPHLEVLDLPPLPGEADDARPLVAVAADPWRPQTVWIGATVEALTARAQVAAPATVGRLVEALRVGVRHRWMPGATLTFRLEGRTPSGRPEAAVLAGANALAVRGEDGWEIVQFLAATPLGDDLWRLTALLRGQRGTRAAPAAEGASVVVLDGLARADMVDAERGGALIWRAGPSGGPPGGPLVREAPTTVAGVHHRPWAPAHLAMRRDGAARTLSWIARSRLDGDGWGAPETASDPARYRVRLLAGDVERGAREVETSDATLSATDLAAAFPEGLAEARAAVSQWGERWGWGLEATVPLA